MIFDKEIAVKMAENLLKVRAVILRPEEPFTWASGWKSPIYCDNRVLLSYPEIRNFVRDSFANLVSKKFPEVKALVGVATAGIAHAALAADRMNLPMAYARSQAKDHGTKSMVEGRLEKNTPVVVIEDLISTGKSSLEIVRGLKDYGVTILGVAGIFSYDFVQAVDAFEAENTVFYTLTDYHVLLETALYINYINDKQLEVLKKWRIAPDIWGK
ncbi:MAG TPA: orotate phosphoribosyltransferase [Bacteroidia bacterium]|nr:orotate phosphoribosyltransferase [Bacteroidia bacterium]HRS59277.1 orotate phosphoribosyltransferase [Bacteroidia bacterium]HRU67133.1 orotate phosphoribosyltransferase [Bacteroidia bacterium]